MAGQAAYASSAVRRLVYRLQLIIPILLLLCTQPANASSPPHGTSERRITATSLWKDAKQIFRLTYWRHVGPAVQHLRVRYALLTYKIANCILWSKQRWRYAMEHVQAVHVAVTQWLASQLQVVAGSSRADAELMASMWPVVAALASFTALGVTAAAMRAYNRRTSPRPHRQ